MVVLLDSYTDADTVVPLLWLVEQLRLAAQGYEPVLGTVSPDADDLPLEVLAAWESRHVLREGHTHVHGANMGLRWRPTSVWAASTR